MGNPAYAGLTQFGAAGPVWGGQVREAVLSDVPQPLRWRRQRRIFVNSMSDLFHKDVSINHIAHVFGVMTCAQQHTFQVLTKRPERMADMLGSASFWDDVIGHSAEYAHLVTAERQYCAAVDSAADRLLPNVWLGTSVEDQRRARERMFHLKRAPAAARFLSCEPLLGPVGDQDLTGIHWVIAGGESGDGARPMHPDWARGLRDQCAAQAVPFFFKQWGEWREWNHGSPDEDVAMAVLANVRNPGWITPDGRFYQSVELVPEGVPCRLMERIGKKAAGAILDGREHMEFPP